MSERHVFDKKRMPEEHRLTKTERAMHASEVFSALDMETPEMHYEAIQGEMDRLFEKYFPEEYKSFCKAGKVSIAKTIDSFTSSSLRKTGNTDDDSYETDIKTKKQKGAFIAAALIRYIDNFIDEQLWPNIHAWDRRLLEHEFASFIREGLQIVRWFDPNMPDSISRIVELEMLLELSPTQETFDTHCVELLQGKSRDMLYVAHLLGKEPTSSVEELDERKRVEYEGVACGDYVRDFSKKNRHKDTDMNLANLLLRGKIFPHVLVEHLNTLERRWFDTHDYGDYRTDPRFVNVVNLRKQLCEIVGEYYDWSDIDG
jgi:hypothetical protein